MPGKKRRRRSGPRPGPDEAPEGRAAGPGTRQSEERRQRKEEARRAREQARKRFRRRALIRRLVTVTVIVSAGLFVFMFLFRAASPKPLSAAASEASDAAGCSGVETPVTGTPSREHLSPGQTYTYDTEPATSGPHASPLPDDPHVYTEMPPETALVHNLEHAFVNIYYRPDGDGALPQDVIDTLTTFANAHARTILSPHTSLPDGVSLAYTAWNKLLTCPSTISATQAGTLAQGWWDSFACSSNAPEPPFRGMC